VRTFAIIAVATVAAGCVETEADVLAEATLLLPEDLQIHWDSSFNGDYDGLGALVPVDVMVYEGDSGEPLGQVEIELRGAEPGVIVVDVDAVHFDVEDCDRCAWDAWRDQYIEVDGSEHAAVFLTDPDGLARAYVWADWFPTEGVGEEEFRPVAVTATLGPTEGSFLVIPQ